MQIPTEIASFLLVLVVLAMYFGYPILAYLLVKRAAVGTPEGWRRRRVIGIALCLTCGPLAVFTMIYLMRATPIYQAVARIQIDREWRDLLKQGELARSELQDESVYLQTQYRTLKSRTLSESVAKQLKLDRDEHYAKRADVVRAVSDDVTVVPIPLSRLLDIQVQHPDPKRAAEIANTLVQGQPSGPA